MTDRPALRRCVSVPPDEFAERYWNREPLLSRATDIDRPGFGDLLDLDGVDELLSRRGLRTPFIRIARNGELVPAAEYTGSGGAGAEIGDQVLDERVFALLDGGATLVLQGLHRMWPALVEFAGALRADLGAPVQVNAYLTPPGNRGFATHYDTHSVFVLQVAGRKRWLVHRPVLADPLDRQPWTGYADEVTATAVGPAYLDTVLAPGDALYLPRGWLHAAEALDEQSLHLTVGLRAPTRYTILEALLELATAEPALRAGLPMCLDIADPDELGPVLADTVKAVHAWLDSLPAGDVAAKLRRQAWSAIRPAPMRPVAQAAAIAGLRPDSRLIVRSGLPWRLEASGAGVTLRLPDRTLSFPASCAAAVRLALRGAPVSVGDLPGLAAEEQLVLARRMLREAILVPL